MSSELIGKVVQGAVVGGCAALGTALFGPAGTIGGLVAGKMLTGVVSDENSEISGSELADNSEYEPLARSEFFDSLFG